MFFVFSEVMTVVYGTFVVLLVVNVCVMVDVFVLVTGLQIEVVVFVTVVCKDVVGVQIFVVW